MPVPTFTLTGTHHNLDGTPQTGHVKVTANAVLRDTTDSVVLSGERVATLDEAGTWALELPADSPALRPEGVGYTVAYHLTGVRVPSSFVPAQPAGTVLDVVVVASSSPSTATVSLLGPQGAKGDKGDTGPAPTAAYEPLRAQLAAGATTGIQVLGDSTGNDTTDWPYRLALVLAAEHPAHTVQSRVWDDATQQFAQPLTVQTGPGGVQHLDGVSAAAKNTLLAPGRHPASGNLDIRVKVQAANWGAAMPLCSLAARAGVSGTYSHWLNVTTTKAVQFVYSVNGTAILTALSTAVLPFTGTQTGWVRVVAIANNGTGSEFRFSTSLDGVTWTPLGATVTAASFALFDGASSFEFGGRGTLTFPGKVYEVEYRDGEHGPLMAPSLPALYGPNPLSTVDAPVVGAPVLTIVNGSHPGATLAYLSDATRLPKLTPDYGQAVAFTSVGHNQGSSTGRPWVTAYRAWLTQLAPLGVPVVPMTQNPQTPSSPNAAAQASRRASVLGLSIDVVDTFAAFLAYGPTWETDLMADSIHPNTAGSDVWRNLVHDRL